MKRRRHSGQTLAYTVPWQDGYREAFRLAPADWTPPERVQVRRTPTAMTLVGRFTNPAGTVSKVTVRWRMTPVGPEVASETTLQQRLTLRFGPTP